METAGMSATPPWPVMSREGISMFSKGFISVLAERRYIDELEQLLDDSMIDQFHVETQDNSVQEVAEQLFFFHEECSLGNYEKILRLAADSSQRNPAVATSLKVPNENGEDSDSDDDSMDAQEEGCPASSGQQDLSMDLEPSSAESGKALQREERIQTLTEEEMANGWQAAPSRSRRRGGRRA